MLQFSNRSARYLIKISPYIISAIVFISFIIGGSYYYLKHKNLSDYQEYASDPSIKTTENDLKTPILAEKDKTAASSAIKKSPPKTGNSTDLSTSSVKTSSGQNAVVVSDGSVSSTDLKNASTYASAGPVSSFTYNDLTGKYPNLGSTLKSYLDSALYHSEDVNYLYKVEVEDCPSCNYGGYWTGSYVINSSGDITKAYGWIRLNVAPYKSSPYLTDYMKLIFSHEYGHHYTMYHRWIDLDIATGQRFPDSYYSVRPLSKNSTAPDYSLGWQNCDAEVIAEDYSYFYSGYGYHAIASYHGYPSSATKTWLQNIKTASAATATNSPPTLSITSPSASAELSSTFPFSVSASDDHAVYKVEFYIDSTKIATDVASPYSISINPGNYASSSHTLKAIAFDAQTSTQKSISVTFAEIETPPDTENPTISIVSPPSTPYAWNSANLNIEAHAQDNVAIQKIELYINDQLVATQNDDSIYRIWVYDSTPAGNYTLKAKGYDTSGNTQETSIVINKS